MSIFDVSLAILVIQTHIGANNQIALAKQRGGPEERTLPLLAAAAASRGRVRA
jgi:hypothetical protein